MATNLVIDPELLQKALEASGLRTKKETVNLALKELINRHKQAEIMDLFQRFQVFRITSQADKGVWRRGLQDPGRPAGERVQD